MVAKRALITGVTGQDGSYLAELLLSLGYEVHGTIRTTTADVATTRIGHLVSDEDSPLTLHVTDLGDSLSLMRIIEAVCPAEIYNLAAQSHVQGSFNQPAHTGDVTGLGAIRLLEAIRQIDTSIRFYQASSSEMFGLSPSPQCERTPFHPRSPYGAAKVYAYWATVNYRESYGLHASNGILFNHESPRRGKEFVTRKISSAIPRLVTGEQKVLRMGNIDVERDWGHARDYVAAMLAMVQSDEPGDYVIGTGRSHSVREFLEVGFAQVDEDWRDYVQIDPELYRPADIACLRADSTKARELLGWAATTEFESLVAEMVRSDMEGHGVHGAS